MIKIKGIDISYCQRNVDYAKAKAAGVGFAIIRSGYREKTDDMLYTHLAGCKKAGIPVGIYVYALAKTETDAIKEARHCLQSIANHEITYPIFYDLEDDRLLDGLSSKQRTDNAIAFLNEVKRQGYYPGIYANPAWLEQYLEYDRLKDYDLWLAAWTESSDKATKYAYGQQMWQWGLDNVNGIGEVDGNLCYVDYPALIIGKNFNIGNASASQAAVDVAGNAEFRAVIKKYRCIGSAVKRRRLASDHATVIGQLAKGVTYDVTAEIYADNKLKWLEIGGAYSMYIDQAGDVLFEEVINGAVSSAEDFKVGDVVKITGTYADSAFAKVAVNKKAVGETRYITKVFTDKAVNFPYMLGVKAGDLSSANTTGFARVEGIKKV